MDDEIPNYRLTEFEPIQFHNQLFGQSLDFFHEKRQIRFTSKFHNPDYLFYNQISHIKVEHDKKRKLLFFSVLTLVLIIGLFLLLVRAYIPSWKIIIFLKQNPSLQIRARFKSSSVDDFIEKCGKEIKIELINNQSKKK